MDDPYEPIAPDPSTEAALHQLSGDRREAADSLMSRLDLFPAAARPATANPEAVIPMAMTMCRDTHQDLPICFLGTLNDRTDLLAWVRVLPACYIGELHPCAKQLPGNPGTLYSYSLQILGFTTQHQDHRVQLFQLYFMADLSRFVVLYKCPDDPATLALPGFGITIAERPSRPGAQWVFHFSVSSAISNTMVRSREFDYHPFRCLRGRLARVLNRPRSSVSGCTCQRDGITYEIMFEFHCRCTDRLWEAIDQTVVDEVARIGAELDIQPDGIEPEKEAAWRIQSREWFAALLESLEKQ
jgi:hypothetical protein